MIPAKSARRTVVTMITAGPEGAVYGVFRACVRNPSQRWSWDIHRARQIGTVSVKAGDRRPSYRSMALQFASPDWPALDYPEDTWPAV